MKAPLPFSVFKRARQPGYLVAFKNQQTGAYMPPISTRQTDRTTAIRTAYEWFLHGIPQQDRVINLKQRSLRDIAKEADPADAEFIVNELKRRGLLKSAVIAESKQDRDFAEYLTHFWDYDTSPYVKEKLRKKHSIHRRYCHDQAGAIKRYWVPYFTGKLLGEITRQDVESFIEYFETLPETKGMRIPKSAKRKNTIIQAGTIALSWAFHKEIIEKDVTQGITWFAGKAGERQILTPELSAAIFKVQWKDERARLANMLAMVTGMRAGEIQGLRIQDLGQDCLYVGHSWNRMDNLKTTKNNEGRTVEVPFPGLIQELLATAATNPYGQGMDGYIFWAGKMASKPMEASLFIDGLRDALMKIGMSKKTAGGYTFHGWRHYYTAYMIGRVTEKLLRKQTGHKTLPMLMHYGDHLLAGDRERIQQAQIATFGGLLPDATTMREGAEGQSLGRVPGFGT
jgi:integrase